MKFASTAAAAAATLAAAAAYARFIEPRWLQLRHRRIAIRDLPPAHAGLRIGLLSDPHLRSPVSDRLLRRAVETLAAAAPDIVAVTGDLAEDDGGLHAALDALAAIDPPLGTYAVPGNHDHRLGIDRWRDAVRARKAITDLTNRYVTIHRGGSTLCLAGVDDPVQGVPRLRLPPPRYRDLTVLLVHSPDQAERARRDRDAIDLVLSGHTHGGQVRIPFLGPAVSPARFPEIYDHGLRTRPWTQVYTSRGIGTTRVPVRFLARPEVAILELVPQHRSVHIEIPLTTAGRPA